MIKQILVRKKFEKISNIWFNKWYWVTIESNKLKLFKPKYRFLVNWSKYKLTSCHKNLTHKLRNFYLSSVIFLENNNIFIRCNFRYSLLIDNRDCQDEFDCLEICKATPECNWFSFYPNSKNCQLLVSF